MATQQPLSKTPPFTTALLAGGIAGTTVDLSLFPLDTLKTRLQSRAGFFASGGFRGVYRGVGSAVVGSAPGAAFFFCTYEGVKDVLSRARRRRHSGDDDDALGLRAGGGRGRGASTWAEPLEHMAAASLGEVAACAVRVPTEVVKQRAQAGHHGGSSAGALRAILQQYGTVGFGGVWRELYRGWGITVMREVPFTVIQFPLWEALKDWGRRRSQGMNAGGVDVGAGESALYGCISGAVAAGITTPLDVLKTRVMLSQERESVLTVLRDLFNNHGVRPFFAGIGPRVAWISAGGAIFLGSYQWAANALQSSL
ncbi:mitochondrial carrier domain-containing protein [Xylaria bambusicola]|uniref:mitochondrial carrier domain-containing protein n=1 Tax=Xylaria bambusicola TaxID=326684 RepID=UPI0020084DFC|nr:mitochondrial carrier domain-containing protein [Xylaria bambusicola]KAI0518564.1 mitochondrial carrier domain-containing protein [Xylaria bambusicola]